MDKKQTRIRRATRLRKKTKELGLTRLVVHRTPRHIYAQVISSDNLVIASASTVDKTIKEQLDGTGNVVAATEVGKVIAKRALDKGVANVSFDRSGFKYHGRISALADAAREIGLKF